MPDHRSTEFVSAVRSKYLVHCDVTVVTELRKMCIVQVYSTLDMVWHNTVRADSDVQNGSEGASAACL